MSANDTRISSSDTNVTFVSTPARDVVESWIDRVYRPERLDRAAGTRQRIVNDHRPRLGCPWGNIGLRA